MQLVEQELFTFPKYLSLAAFCYIYQCDWCCSFCQSTRFHVVEFSCTLLSCVLLGMHILSMFIDVYWRQIRFPYQMMFVSFNSNTTGVTCGAGTANSSGTSEYTPGFSGFALLDIQFSVQCFLTAISAYNAFLE